MAWSFVLAYVMYTLLQKIPFKETLCITWLVAFVLMWISSYNLQIFPMMVLCVGAPLSLVEVFVAGC